MEPDNPRTWRATQAIGFGVMVLGFLILCAGADSDFGLYGGGIATLGGLAALIIGAVEERHAKNRLLDDLYERRKAERRGNHEKD